MINLDESNFFNTYSVTQSTSSSSSNNVLHDILSEIGHVAAPKKKKKAIDLINKEMQKKLYNFKSRS